MIMRHGDRVGFAWFCWFWNKLVRAGDLRPTRFHTRRGQLAIHTIGDLLDLSFSVVTAVAKIGGFRPALPWIPLSAMRFLRRIVPANAKVFEWGAGMSTVWWERHAAEVHSAEDSPDWCDILRAELRTAQVRHLTGESYVEYLAAFPAAYFDVVCVDGSDRMACFDLAVSRLRNGGVLVIDNTDGTTRDMLAINARLTEIAASGHWVVHRFLGWPPCTLFATETTICMKSSSR